MSILLELIESPTNDARILIDELNAELSGPYSQEQRHGLSIQRIFQPNVLFFIARLNNDPAGCGGVAFDSDFAEVKRMYVRPQARGCGVAKAILNRLEAEAHVRSIKRLTLETGDAQIAAIALYTRVGFTRCTAFGSYIHMPPAAIHRSVFFEKWIT